MVIKKLELQGFKSFAERTKVVFHRGITAVVGPNGTGKSNLVDGMLWVMGGLRLKSVRGDRTEDVIFNGNAKRTPLGMADAVLVLGGDEEEMVVSHRVFRSGESEYRMNGKSVRLKDIQDELWKHSIGEKEYFVIEQGAIGSFVTSKPSEKRALLEEAAGTAYYKDKKRQAQTKLESTEQNLIRLEDIIAEVEKAKNSLQRQAQAAARYRRLRERIRELMTAHFQRKLRRLEAAQREAAAICASCLEREQMIASRSRSEEKDLAGRRSRLWQLEQSLKESREKLFALQSQISRLESEAERESKRVEYFQDLKTKAEADRSELVQEAGLLDQEIAEIQSQLEEKAGTTDSRRAEVEAAAAEAGRTRQEAELLEKSIERFREEHLEILQETTEKKNERAKAEKEHEILLREEEKLKTQLRDQAVLLENQKRILDEDRTALAGHQARKEDKEQKTAALRERLAALAAGIADVEGNAASLKNLKDEMSHRLQALKKIRNLAPGDETPEVPGAMGALADLVRARPEDTPLFDTFWKEEAGCPAIRQEDFLRHLEPGMRGRFLLLSDAPEVEVPAEVRDDPRVLGLLKSRLVLDERIKGRLSRLGDAVIVGGISEAVSLWAARPGLNFVTPAGDILLASGLLKLGQKEDGAFALAGEIRGAEEEWERLDSELQPVLARAEALLLERAALEADLESETAALNEEEKAILEKTRELRFRQAELDRAGTNADILGRELAVLEPEKESLAQRLEEFNSSIAAGESKEREVKTRIEEAEREMSGLQKRDGLAAERLFELKSGLELQEEKMNSLRSQRQTLARRRESIRAKTTQLDDDLRNGQAETARLRGEIEALKEKARAMEEEKSRGEADLAAGEAELQGIRKEEEDLERKVQASRREEETAKDERVRREIHKAEVDRDLINLEETCWQEIKKTLSELRAEMDAGEKPGEAPGEGAAEPAEEDILEAEEEPEAEEAGPAPAEAREAARPKRIPKAWRPIGELTDEGVEADLEEANDSLQRYKAVNLMAEEEYLDQKKRFDFLVKQRQDLRESIDSTQEAIRKIDEESKSQFLKALGEVNTNFREVFALLFKGGNAEVKLLEPENPLESGVEIVAQPPGKRVQNLALLSGGEKSLTSLAFMFALFRYKPSPFCFLDEVDAALDDVNLARFLDLMMAIKTQTQFIIVTHNYKTMEVADYIYGTTMEEPNVTKLYSVKIEKKEDLKAPA